MDEYIKRKDAEEYIKNFGKGAISDGLKTLDPVDDIVSLARGIDMIPAADVAEVKHGEWIEHFNFGCWHYDCPFCDFGFATQIRNEDTPNYCENCGAKMDKKEGAENAT